MARERRAFTSHGSIGRMESMGDDSISQFLCPTIDVNGWHNTTTLWAKRHFRSDRHDPGHSCEEFLTLLKKFLPYPILATMFISNFLSFANLSADIFQIRQFERNVLFSFGKPSGSIWEFQPEWNPRVITDNRWISADQKEGCAACGARSSRCQVHPATSLQLRSVLMILVDTKFIIRDLEHLN